MSEELVGTGFKDPTLDPLPKAARKSLEPGDRPIRDRLARAENESQPMAMRENAAGLLQRKIDYHYARAQGLEALRDTLPRCLSPAADEALWKLLQNEKW